MNFYPNVTLISLFKQIVSAFTDSDSIYTDKCHLFKSGCAEANFLWEGTKKWRRNENSISCEISKFLLHKSKKDGGAQAPSAPPVPHPLYSYDKMISFRNVLMFALEGGYLYYEHVVQW